MTTFDREAQATHESFVADVTISAVCIITALIAFAVVMERVL